MSNASNPMPLSAVYHTLEYADEAATALHEAVYLLVEGQANPAKVESLIMILRALTRTINHEIYTAKEALGAEAIRELEMHRPKHRSQAVAEEATK